MLTAALKASQGDLSQAIALLTAQVPEEEAEPVAGDGRAWSSQRRIVEISLDGPKDDLQTAIELSLQESQNAQEEERELNRALEASVEESAANAKRKRCEASGESANPADWIRQDDWPVGVRNVGNTCWFSAVIQSLFHLPVFRRLVLNYILSERDKRNVAFMQELRCLFALMVGSKRRFVDPSAAVELLKDAFRTSEAQQDVSEFTHKLLDWLEDAFQLAAHGSNPEDKQENPMVQLFYGTFVAERTIEGSTVSNIEQFGQYPLQVNGFNNLDECLEGAMVEGEIESLHSDQTFPCGRQRWFSKLPPVLTFELSRFEFNQSLGRPEKIHKKLEFPQVMYMDRYLHKNIEQMQGRREEVKKLKNQLMALHQKLESYKSYGSGPTKYPLADMLEYVLEFATTTPTSTSPVKDVRHQLQTSPADPSSALDDPLSGQEDAGPSESLTYQGPASQRSPVHKPFTQCRPVMDAPQHPSPHSISEEELLCVKSCLQRWRIEVENSINELKSSIEGISQSLGGMYSDGSLCQAPYRLHAVLVHEGQASAGHYWAYVYDHSRQCWLKCNDVSVTESSWEELVRDSYGGMTNASAYCLMYIDDSLPHLVAEDTDVETGQVLQGMDALPPILRRYVQEDNRWFKQELQEWEEQLCRRPQEEPTLPSQCVTQERPLEQVAEAVGAGENPDRQAREEMAQAGGDEEEPQAEPQPQAFHEEYSRLYQLSQEETTPQSDPRLQHVLVYFFQNRAPNRVVERTLLEQFADRNLSYDERSIGIMKEARAKLRLIKPEDMDMEEYMKWHEDYNLFRKVFVYLLTGLEQYQNGKYVDALNYLVYAFQNNRELLMEGDRKGVEQQFIALYRRKCLTELNENAAKLFASGDESNVAAGLSIMNNTVIPCMHLMIRDSVSQEDLDVIEAMRSRWCSYLEQDMEGVLQEKLSEFLPRLLDCSVGRIEITEPPKVRPGVPHDLGSRLAAVMESIHDTSIVTVK
uniref:Ubiquitin carboxyl-terminal hydrolase n=1 Tax=Scleropages formosus TaxID=113540 RepID=A0A8C9UBA4_SCLFO